MDTEINLEMDIQDEIGNQFRAVVTLPISELREVLRRHGYTLEKN